MLHGVAVEPAPLVLGADFASLKEGDFVVVEHAYPFDPGFIAPRREVQIVRRIGRRTFSTTGRAWEPMKDADSWSIKTGEFSHRLLHAPRRARTTTLLIAEAREACKEHNHAHAALADEHAALVKGLPNYWHKVSIDKLRRVVAILNEKE